MARIPGSARTSPSELVKPVKRLAQAQARKYVGMVLKDKWQIEEPIGSGGMAQVYAARHRNGRRCAIKFMRPELMLDPGLVGRFPELAVALEPDYHPNFVIRGLTALHLNG